MSQLERVQLATAPHLTANYNSSSSKSSARLSKGKSRHAWLIVSLTLCPINRVFPLPLLLTRTLARAKMYETLICVSHSQKKRDFYNLDTTPPGLKVLNCRGSR